MYRHHLEQTYKLCRPCQAAVEFYIKHQNRQLRALLLSQHFRSRDSDRGQGQVRGEQGQSHSQVLGTLGRAGTGLCAAAPAKGRQQPVAL